jgi:hypothetical protein
MAKKLSGRKKTVKTIDEFDKVYLPKLCESRILEAESEEPTAFAQRLAASLFNNIKNELRR